MEKLLYLALQVVKLVDAVYQKKIEADVIDDAQGNERQNACEFLYDYMLNSYGLKGLAESAIHGVFRRIKQMMIKGIDKFHKVKTWLCNFLLFACDLVRKSSVWCFSTRMLSSQELHEFRNL